MTEEESLKQYDCYIIGPISIDTEVSHTGATRKMVSGALLFSSYAAVAGGKRVGALGKLAEEDMYVTPSFYVQDLTLVPSKASTRMHVIYETADRERRKLKLVSVCDPITAEDIPTDIEADVFHLAGLEYGDFDFGLFPYLAKRGKVACDLQGFLRHVRNDNLVYDDWLEKKEYIPYITYLKADAAEAELITGLADRREAAQQLYDWGAKEVMITHNTEVLIYDGKQFYTCPIRARNLVGRSGRGDSTFGSYITERTDKGIPESLFYATSLVSLKMEAFGPFKGRRKDVEAYQREFYSDLLG